MFFFPSLLLSVLISLLMAFGVVVIINRKLTFHHNFPDVPHGAHVVAEPILLGLAGWFVYTCMQAVRMARSGQYRLHQKWMIRHVASGLWVAAQRLIVFPIFTPIFDFLYPPPDAIVPRWLQREAFAGAGILGIILCFPAAEYAIQRISTHPSSSVSTASRKKDD